jgi:transposase-like protein
MPVLTFQPNVTTNSSDATLAVCPGCHTSAGSITIAAVRAGAAWRCARCAQHWDADRLTAVANYGGWLSAHTLAASAGVSPSHPSVAR